jgi:hypothetical protein
MVGTVEGSQCSNSQSYSLHPGWGIVGSQGSNSQSYSLHPGWGIVGSQGSNSELLTASWVGDSGCPLNGGLSGYSKESLTMDHSG